MVGARCFGCCQAHRGLPLGLVLFWHSVLCTVKSLSLLFLLFISWIIFSRRWCVDKLGVFHANRASMCLDPHLNFRWGLCCKTGLSLPVKYFYWPFVILVLCLSCFRVCSLLPCGHLLGKGWPLDSCFWYLIVLSHVVSWVRCGPWLYWFRIFAAFLLLWEGNVKLIVCTYAPVLPQYSYVHYFNNIWPNQTNHKQQWFPAMIWMFLSEHASFYFV